jgi:hypothetical protein
MQVCIEVMFGDTDSRHEADVRSVALGLTNDRASVRVFPQEGDPRWLVAEFTMATEAQYRAVQRIDRSMRFSLWEREDSVIRFPKTARKKKPKRKRP